MPIIWQTFIKDAIYLLIRMKKIKEMIKKMAYCRQCKENKPLKAFSWTEEFELDPRKVSWVCDDCCEKDNEIGGM